MTPARLLKHFDRISEAPDAVSRLRRFILDLAVRGKLVPQDPSDEPTAELLKRIHAERARLVRTGDAKKEKAYPVVGGDEVPFEVPASWQWVRIRQVTSDRGQAIPSRDFTYIDVTAIDKEVGRVSAPKIVSSADAPSRARKVVHFGDVLYSCVRPYLLNIAVIDAEITPAPIASTAFAVLNGYGLVLSKYLWIVLRSPFMVGCVESKMRGQAYPAINDSDFALLPLPLPPLAEQHRLIAKVDELMALCDRLESAQEERENRRDRLVAVSLDRLSQSASYESVRESIRFHLEHLDRLTTSPGQIGALRRAIVSLAIRGRLVGRVTEDGAFVTVNPVSTAKFDSNAFSEARDLVDVPSHWRVAALAQVAEAIVDCPHSTPNWTDSGKICVRTSQFRPGRLDLSDVRFVSDETFLERIQRLRPVENDLLYSREGGILGVACRVPPNTELCLGQRMMLIRAAQCVAPAFLELVLNSPMITELARGKTTGGAAPRINVATVKAYPIPLPPLLEQHLIVAKVAELMALCDRLELIVAMAQAERKRLLDAVINEALAVNSSAVEERSRHPLFNRDFEGLRQTPSGSPRTVPVPFLGTIAAGVLTLAEQFIEDWFHIPETLVTGVDDAWCVLRVKGDSMNLAAIDDRRIEGGDFLLVRRQDAPEAGRIVVAEFEGEAVLKRFVKAASGAVLRAESTESYLDIPVEPGFRIQGVVQANLKSGSEFERTEDRNASRHRAGDRKRTQPDRGALRARTSA